jgi:DNA-binding transcriptional LysR family regulator
MLEWDDLRHFLVIARHGTLSAAARALGVQQSTMGRRLEAIEQRVGARLLQRTSNGFQPTEAGAAILVNAERMESEALAIERAISGKDERLEGTIRITVVEVLAAEVLAPILAAFKRKYPDITPHVMTDTRLYNLLTGEADIALRLTPFTQHEITVRKLAEVPIGIYASQAYLEAQGAPDFTQGAPGHAVLTEPESQSAAARTGWFLALSHQARIALRSNNYYMLTAAAEADMGIAALPRFLGDAAHLRLIDTPEPAPVRALWMGIHRDLRHTPRIRVLADFLAAQVKLSPALHAI